MNILVTGANGFIGSHICEYFHKKNHHVVGWDIIGNNEDWPLVKVDLQNESEIFEHLLSAQPDIIIHCAGAADVSKSVLNPNWDFQGNVTTTHNLFFAIHKARLSRVRVLFLSSAAVYGNPERLPIREEARISPLSPYALHKVMSEDICQYFFTYYELDVKILRIFSAYGKGLKKQIFWDMHMKAKTTGELKMYGTGKESRDYIYILDLVRAIYLVAMKAPREELIYNIANGEESTIQYATECFAQAIGMPYERISFSGEVKEGNPINWQADISKLVSLGYQRSMSLSEGISLYARWAEKEK